MGIFGIGRKDIFKEEANRVPRAPFDVLTLRGDPSVIAEYAAILNGPNGPQAPCKRIALGCNVVHPTLVPRHPLAGEVNDPQ